MARKPRATRYLKVFGVFTTLVLFAGAAFAAWPWFAGLSEQNFNRSKTFTKQTAVAENLVLHLEGKPAMGFVWRLARESSSGLNLVSVEELGWSFAAGRGSASFTKPGILRYLVVGKRPGKARLVFEYRRELENASPSAYWTYELEITR